MRGDSGLVIYGCLRSDSGRIPKHKLSSPCAVWYDISGTTTECAMEPQWLTYGKRLQAIASSGLHFARDQFDRERYEEIASIANEMLANLGSVPIDRIEGLISDFAKGYATPKVDVRGAIVEENKVLLVREKSDGLWALPGGFADVGLSAAQNIAKELYEEAELKVSVRRLYGVRHKAGTSYSPDVRDSTKFSFFAIGSQAVRPGPDWRRARRSFSRKIGYLRCREVELSRVTLKQPSHSQLTRTDLPSSIESSIHSLGPHSLVRQ